MVVTKKSESASLLAHLFKTLREKQIRLTGPRRAIVQALGENHGPFSAEDLHKRFVKDSCDLATVYRTLISLEENELIRRCEFGDGVARYELILDGTHHHHHVICKKCRKVEVLEDCDLEQLIEKTLRKRRFSQVSHHLEFFGICPRCQ